MGEGKCEWSSARSERRQGLALGEHLGGKGSEEASEVVRKPKN